MSNWALATILRRACGGLTRPRHDLAEQLSRLGLFLIHALVAAGVWGALSSQLT